MPDTVMDPADPRYAAALAEGKRAMTPTDATEADRIIRLAVEMRSKQKLFFSTKARDALDASKKLEREFDAAASAYLHPPAQGDLI